MLNNEHLYPKSKRLNWVKYHSCLQMGDRCCSSNEIRNWQQSETRHLWNLYCSTCAIRTTGPNTVRRCNC